MTGTEYETGSSRRSHTVRCSSDSVPRSRYILAQNSQYCVVCRIVEHPASMVANEANPLHLPMHEQPRTIHSVVDAMIYRSIIQTFTRQPLLYLFSLTFTPYFVPHSHRLRLSTPSKELIAIWWARDPTESWWILGKVWPGSSTSCW